MRLRESNPDTTKIYLLIMELENEFFDDWGRPSLAFVPESDPRLNRIRELVGGATARDISVRQLRKGFIPAVFLNKEVIKAQQKYLGYEDKFMAEMIGVSATFIYKKKLAEATSFTPKELLIVCEVLQLEAVSLIDIQAIEKLELEVFYEKGWIKEQLRKNVATVMQKRI